jgi:hypothetical protein
VIEDTAQTTPAACVSSINSWNLESDYFFTTKTHALRCRFENEDSDYQQDERIVYNTGYDENSATVIEDMTFRGITDPDQVWKMAIYHFAVATHRPSQLSVEMDFEHMVIDKRGTLIYVNHDVIEKGLDSGLITAVGVSASNVVTITVDETFTMEVGKSYAVQIRKSTNAVISHNINTVAGANKTLTFTTPFSKYGQIPVIGDLCFFGLAGSVSARYILKGIEPAQKHTARLTLVPEGPSIYTSDSGDIPAWTSNITREATTRQNFPPTPVIYHIRSDESVMLRQGRTNSLITRALISLKPQKRDGVQADFYQVRYKRTGEVQWKKTDLVEAANNEIYVEDLEDLIEYDLEVRAQTREGLTSAWAYTYTDYKNAAASLHAYTIVGKSNNPSIVTGLTVSIVDGRPQAAWTKVADLDVIGYELRWRLGSGTWESASSTAIKVGDVDIAYLPTLLAGTWYVMIKAFDCNKTPLYSSSEAQTTITIFRPGTPKNNGSHADANAVNLFWSDTVTSFPIAYCRIYKSGTANYETATIAQCPVIGTSKSQMKVISEMVPGTRKYFILPVDTAGNSATTALEVTLTSGYPGKIAYIQTVNFDLNAAVTENCRPDGLFDSGWTPPGKPYSGSNWLFAPINKTESWQEHMETAESFQGQIDLGYEKFAEPGPDITDNGDGTSDCYCYWDAINSGTGFSVPLVAGCKVKVDLEKLDIVDNQGEKKMEIIPLIGIYGTDRSGDSYSQEVHSYEFTVDENFRFADELILYLYFFRDNDVRSLCKIRNVNMVIQHPEVTETQVVAVIPGGTEVEFTTPVSVITGISVTEIGTAGQGGGSSNWSNYAGVDPSYPATADITLGAAAAGSGNASVSMKGY